MPTKEYYQKNKDKILKKMKGYYKENKQKILNKNKEYHRKNKENISKYHKKYRNDNKMNRKEYYKENKQKLINYDKERYKNKKGHIQLQSKEYRKTIKGKESVKRGNKNRREKKNNIIETFTMKEWNKKLDLTQGVCPGCNLFIGKLKLTLDHIYPVSIASKDYKETGIKREYKIEDVQPLCRSCNSKKGVKNCVLRISC